jgi:hypothetical protein
MRASFLAFALACPPASQDELPPPVVVAEQAVQPWAAIDPEGTIYVVFLRNGNVELSLSTDQGKTFSAPAAALDARGQAAGGNQRGPRVAAGAKKQIVVTVALPSAEPPVTPGLNDLYAAFSSDRGKSFTKPVPVNDTPRSATPSLHAAGLSPSGVLHAAWVDSRQAGTLALGYGKVSEDAKKTPRTLLLGATVCERCAPGVAVDGKGNPYVVWREGGPPKKNRQILLAASSNGGASFKQSPANELDTLTAACPADAPAVGVSPDGKTVAVAWMDLRAGFDDCNVYWTVSRDGKFPREEAVHDDRRYYQGHPTVAVDKDGVAWCAWEDGRHGTQRIYACSTGRRLNFSVTGPKDPRAAFPSLAAGGGLVGVAYESGAGVAFRLLSKAP